MCVCVNKEEFSHPLYSVCGLLLTTSVVPKQTYHVHKLFHFLKVITAILEEIFTIFLSKDFLVCIAYTCVQWNLSYQDTFKCGHLNIQDAIAVAKYHICAQLDL